jgi:starch synthase
VVRSVAQKEERNWNMKVLFATAEYAPLARVGGLGEAAAGLVRALRTDRVDVEVVLPDYFSAPLRDEISVVLDVPEWVGIARARSGIAEGSGEVTLVEVPGIRRPNPYVDSDGNGWPDNADRFFAFSAAVGALAELRRPDVLHCNDWHTAAAFGFVEDALPKILTIHTLGYQGWTSGGWLDRIPDHAAAFESHGGTNPMAGGIQLADVVIAVSPTYATEIRREETGFGLHEQLLDLGDRLIGIRNGIDTGLWNPATDPHIACRYDSADIGGKALCRADLLDAVGWGDTGVPIVGIVSRLVEQKGIDLALEAARFSATMPFRLVVLGSGERWLSDYARYMVTEHPDTIWFNDGYDLELAHKIFAGSDLMLLPSRFEPCGLSQMQAMEYGTIPVVTAVGGLLDTVTDADRDRISGTGFVSESVDAAGIVDALHRGVRAWKHPRRRRSIQSRGMETDWSWKEPALHHLEAYELATILSRS